MKNMKVVATVISLITVLFGIVCCFLLPDTVAVQWGANGEVSNTMRSYLAVLVTYALCALMLVIAFSKKNESYIWLSTIGFALQIVLLITNL